MNKYTGLYFDKDRNILREIGTENGSLIYRRSLHNRSILKHIENDIFTMDVYDFIRIEFKDDPKSFILTNLSDGKVQVFSSEGFSMEKCPACSGKALIRFQEHDTSFRINCPDNCGEFTIMKRDCFDALPDKHRKWISALNYNLSYNNIQNYYGEETVRWIIEEYEFIDTAAAEYGFEDAVIEYAGGCDGPDPVYIIRTPGKKYSIRLFSPEFGLSMIETMIRWHEHLTKDGIVLAPVDPDRDGNKIHYSEALKRYSVIREWNEGEPLFNISMTGLPDDMPEKLGELLARMHESLLSLELPESCAVVKRGYEFYSNFYQEHLKSDFASEEEKEEFIGIFTDFLEALKELDKLEDQKAVIHGDLTTRNVIYGNGQYIPIDFKNIKYDYLLIDIVQLFVNELKEDQQIKFWEGYERIRKVPEKWKDLCPAIIKAVEMRLIRVEDV